MEYEEYGKPCNIKVDKKLNYDEILIFAKHKRDASKNLVYVTESKEQFDKLKIDFMFDNYRHKYVTLNNIDGSYYENTFLKIWVFAYTFPTLFEGKEIYYIEINRIP